MGQLKKKNKKTSMATINSEIDVKLIEYNLSLSLQKRIIQHESARQLMISLQRASVKSRGKSK